MKKIYFAIVFIFINTWLLGINTALCQDPTTTKEYIKELYGGIGDTIPNQYALFHKDSVLTIDIRCESNDFKVKCDCNIYSHIIIYKNARQIDINFCKNARPIRISPYITRLSHLNQLIMVDVKVDENTYPANFGELDSLTYLSAFVVNDKIPTQFFSLKSVDYLSLEYSHKWIDETIYNDLIKLAEIKSLKRLIIWNLKLTPKKREHIKAYFIGKGITLSI